MAADRSLRHSSWTGDNQSRYRVAENVGMGPDVRTVFDRFMASPSHRDNILNPRLTQVGVGVVAGGGSLWVTVDFRGAG